MKPLDSIDRALLAALRANARAPITSLAATVGATRATVKARLEALQAAGRIRRFTIETDVDEDGAVRAISLVQLQGRMSRTVIATLTKIPDVATVYSTNGNWDLVVEIKTDSLVSFDRVLREIREVPGVLNSESCLLLSRVTG